MRPKKRVVVLAAQEVSRDVLCFLLETWGYAAFPERVLERFRRSIGAQQMDAVIAVLPGWRQWPALRLAQELGVPVMSLDLVANAPGSVANLSLASTAAPAEIREALRILAIRKRGPKKQRPVMQQARVS